MSINVLASLVIKGASIAIGLMLVPMLIKYLGKTKYGIWITLSSIVSWMSFFDIGLGNGLRNMFAIAVSNGKQRLARIYVSTAYFSLAVISLILTSAYLIVSHRINWNKILGVSIDLISSEELKLSILVLVCCFALSLVLKLIGSVVQADQRPAILNLISLLGKLLVLGSLVFLIYMDSIPSSMIYLALSTGVLPLLAYLIASLVLFRYRYNKYKPSIRLFDISQTRELLSLGSKFFIVQIAFILIYQTNNFIINTYFGPEKVTDYNVAFTYFSVLTMGFNIIVSPFWSAFTEAWEKEEMEWIRSKMSFLFRLWLALVFVATLMFITAPLIYRIWLGSRLEISYSITAYVFVIVIINLLNTLYSNFLNGVGKIKLQYLLSIILAVVNLPLAIGLGKVLGVSGVFLSNILISLIGVILYSVQYRLLINGKAKRIWNE